MDSEARWDAFHSQRLPLPPTARNDLEHHPLPERGDAIYPHLLTPTPTPGSGEQETHQQFQPHLLDFQSVPNFQPPTEFPDFQPPTEFPYFQPPTEFQETRLLAHFHDSIQDFQPHTHFHHPSTNRQVPPTHFQLPSAGSQQRPTYYQHPSVGSQLPPTHYQNPFMGSQVPPTHIQQPPTDSQVPHPHFQQQPRPHFQHPYMEPPANFHHPVVGPQLPHTYPPMGSYLRRDQLAGIEQFEQVLQPEAFVPGRQQELPSKKRDNNVSMTTFHFNRY